jgi:hypothetical protein
MKKVEVDIIEVVRITENHGGYLGGNCIACGSIGWLDERLGYRYKSKNISSNSLIHKRNCPMNKFARLGK